MASVQTRNGDIYYEISGTGNVLVVLICGMGRSSQHWIGLDGLATDERLKVLKWDPRGTGNSSAAVPWSLTIEDLAEDLFQIMDDAQIESAHIVGLSLGGMVALAAARLCAERTRSIQLMNSSVGGFRIPRITHQALMAMTAVHKAQDDFNDGLLSRLAGDRLSEEQRNEILTRWRGISEDRRRLSLTVAKQLLAASRFQVARDLGQLNLPVHVLVGTADQWVPPTNSFLLHQAIPASRLSVFAGGGHELMLDRGSEVCDVLSSFVQEVEDRRFPSSH
jgi:3-oxoadipate enol-lactonase